MDYFSFLIFAFNAGLAIYLGWLWYRYRSKETLAYGLLALLFAVLSFIAMFQVHILNKVVGIVVSFLPGGVEIHYAARLLVAVFLMLLLFRVTVYGDVKKFIRHWKNQKR